MADAPDENEFGKELAAAFEADEAVENPVTPEAAEALKDPKDPVTPPTDAPKVEEPKKDDPATPPADPKKKEDSTTSPADPATPPQEDPAKPKASEAPVEPEAPKPLTEEGVRKLMNEVRTEERTSGQAIQSATDEVMEAYYPGGLSNVLVDQSSGKELRTPKDVVDASGGDMSMEDAAKWLMNEQYKLDQNIAKIRGDAGKIAETTLTFKNNSITALQKYQPLFKAYPYLQTKVFDKMMKLVKADEVKNVILTAPDPLEFYDDYLEPYQQAYEFGTRQSATNPVNPVTPPTAPPAAPGAADRMDEGGDGGATTEVDDPNDFAQQVTKELAKGI